MESQPYVLTELEDLSSIFSPLKTTTRIKYTCFNTSENFLIFGATSGGLYVFRREPCCFLQLLPNKEGSVTQVSISPDEKLIAFSTVRGLTCVLEKTSHGAKNLVTTTEHQNAQITSLQWNDSNSELFVGDSKGKVSIVTVSVFPTKAMFQTPSFVLMQLDSRIVQMDFSSNMLLVSTQNKCYICDTKKEIFKQVGHKLRDGEFGACILNSQINDGGVINEFHNSSNEVSNLNHLKLFCARPGSRVWECAIDGTVISTHHFKEALAVPPRKIYFLSDASSQNSDIGNTVLTNGSCIDNERINSDSTEQQSFNFQKLYVISSKFFFTFKSDGIYIFDPQKSAVVLWNNEITNIIDAKSANDVLYIWSGFGKVYALNLLPLDKLLIRLYFQKRYSELASLCIEFGNFLLAEGCNCSKLYILHDLDEKLKSCKNSETLCDLLNPLIDVFKKNAQMKKTQSSQKLKTGIYVVNNNDQILSEDKRLFNQKLLSLNHLNLKGRSHSVSPERFQNGDATNRGSSSSLPDLLQVRKVEEESGWERAVGNGKNHKVSTLPEPPQPPFPIPASTDIHNICEIIRKSRDPSNNLVFSLLDNVLALGPCDTLEMVESLPLDAYFNRDDLNLISELFHSSLNSKLLLEWLPKFRGDWLESAVKCYPDILLQNHSAESLELDVKLSKVLRIFSLILNEKEIVESIRATNIDCYYSSLSEILDVFQESSLTSVSDSTLNLANVSSTPKILNIAYFLINVGQVDQCSKYSEKIHLTEMFYLMLKFGENSGASGKSREIVELQCHTLFLTYLDKICGGTKFLNGCDDVVEKYVINCLENINATAGCLRVASCDCGFPSAVLQPTIAMFPDVGYALLEKAYPKYSSKALDICGRVPYLWEYLIFMRRSEPLNSVLPLILQSGDVQELETRSEEFDNETLESSVKLLICLKKGNCLNCHEELKSKGDTVSWTEFGMLCIKLCGPKKTLDVYKKYADDISSKELDGTFYQGLIFSSIMERHGEGLGKNVVNLLTGNGSGDANRVPLFSDDIRHRVFGEDCEKSHTSQKPETTSHHWGVRVNFKENCLVCSLPLDTKVLLGEAGLVVFKCAHVFHSACLSKVNLECPICKNLAASEGGKETGKKNENENKNE